MLAQAAPSQFWVQALDLDSGVAASMQHLVGKAFPVEQPPTEVQLIVFVQPSL